jgi:hypothetical protein
MIDQGVMLALTVSGLLLSRQPPPQQPIPNAPSDAAPADTKAEGPKSPQWKGLTVKEKLSYDWRHLFDPENVIFAGIGAGFDQLRDRPGQWGEGWGPYAGRYGSHLAQYAIQRSIMFPVQAIDHRTLGIFRRAGKRSRGALETHFFTPSGAITTAEA